MTCGGTGKGPESGPVVSVESSDKLVESVLALARPKSSLWHQGRKCDCATGGCVAGGVKRGIIRDAIGVSLSPICVFFLN